MNKFKYVLPLLAFIGILVGIVLCAGAAYGVIYMGMWLPTTNISKGAIIACEIVWWIFFGVEVLIGSIGLGLTQLIMLIFVIPFVYEWCNENI